MLPKPEVMSSVCVSLSTPFSLVFGEKGHVLSNLVIVLIFLMFTLLSHYKEIWKLLAMEQEHFEDEVHRLVSTDGSFLITIFHKLDLLLLSLPSSMLLIVYLFSGNTTCSDEIELFVYITRFSGGQGWRTDDT